MSQTENFPTAASIEEAAARYRIAAVALRREIAADPLTRPVAPTDTEATP